MSELSVEVKSFSKDLKFEPIPMLERAWEIIKQWNPKPLSSFEGVDLTELSKRIEKPLMTLRMEHFYTDKSEKISLGWIYYTGPGLAQTIAICPSDDYDLPIFIVDLRERARGSSLSVDLWPTVDLAAEEWYKEKYYDELAPIYSKYWDLERKKIMLHASLSWLRSFTSPYELNLELPPDRKDTLTEIFTDYVRHYGNIYRKAEPIKDPKLKEYIVKKKRVLRRWFREKDPVKWVLIRTVGADMEKKIMVALL